MPAADAVAAAVDALVGARQSYRCTPAADVPLPDAEAAYAVQEGVARRLRWFVAGEPSTWKVGVASGALRRTHARLPPAGVWHSPAHAADWPFNLRGIEAEIAFRLGRDVTPQEAVALDVADAAALIDAMCVSIEIADSRWMEGLKAPALNLLADLQSHGALVLGDWAPFAPSDWTMQVCRGAVGSQLAVERRGSHALGDPTQLLVDWMRHATHGGQALPAGSVVTTGSWVGIIDAMRGDGVDAEFPGIGAASVRL
jgi:2-keto-4-pentenoate hydratase